MATAFRNDAEFTALRAAGYTGHLNDMEYQYWVGFKGLPEIPWGDERRDQMASIAATQLFTLDDDSWEAYEYSFWTQATLA